MLILRNKNYSIPKPGEMIDPSSKSGLPQQGNNNSQEVSARDIQVAQMRLQRQQILLQHQKQQLLMKNEMQKRRALLQRQKMDAEEKISEGKDRIRTKQLEKDNNPDNTSLYKTRSKVVQPVPMKD